MSQLKKQKTKESPRKTTTVSLRYLHVAPRKARLVAHMIKGLTVNEALAQLTLSPRRSSDPIAKLLRAGIESAKNKGFKMESLIISSARVDKGPIMKRWMPRAMGRATPIHKVMSHIILVLEETTKKVKQSRFVMETKKKKEKASHKHEHDGHAHEKEGHEKESARHEEKSKEGSDNAKIPSPKEEKRGFVKKIFRRKSV